MTTAKQFPLRFPLELYRRVSAAAGIACVPMSQWIFDACRAKLLAMPVQIPERVMSRNPVEVPPPALLDDAPAPRILKPLF
jgi:hypothetical protein